MSKHDIIPSANIARNYLQKFILWPRQWRSLSLPIRLTWKCIKYTKGNMRKLPKQKGVYAFTVKPKIGNLNNVCYLMYIGKAKDQTLRTRCRQYFYEQHKPKPRIRIMRMLSNWSNNLYLYYAAITSTTISVDSIEDKLISAFIPPINSEFPGTLSSIAKDVYGS